eukprot:CAMPEP_0179123304 /NCGR_PEP_ID=MMETSP0796-20121207/58229_1 /TAXON_ID=73915 /ORGANISM="Pyrodinium bahamense, Strain pbaha01" /LENGTH=143 /DNA_ID=CAMNT_0020821947 /DNA_START=67 /DNA_END=494 /DNA_ORIENTATION=+
MARSAARCLLGLAAAAVVVLQLAAPHAFVPSPTSVPAARPPTPAVAGAAAGSLLALPAWAYGTEAVDAQLLLARIPGGKFAKEKNLVVPAPEEDGFTDAQVGTCLAIALLAGLAAWDLAKGLERGITPIKAKDGSKKGSVTPL